MAATTADAPRVINDVDGNEENIFVVGIPKRVEEGVVTTLIRLSLREGIVVANDVDWLYLEDFCCLY